MQGHDGSLWLFTAELFGLPVDARMRVAVWTAPRALGPWRRVRTIAESNQTFPLTDFRQECTQSYCPDRNATVTSMAYTARFACDPADLLASPWAPMPVYDTENDTWTVLFVGYQCDFRQLVLAGAGNIFLARSEVVGQAGIGGPYRVEGIVLGPNATRAGTKFGTAGRGEYYIDEMNPYVLPNGSLAAIVGENFWLATATRPGGPWVVSSLNITSAFVTNGSPYNENPIVSTVTGPAGDTVYLAVFDTVFNEAHGFGMSYSYDGIHWSPGADVSLPRGCRTPLGLFAAKTTSTGNTQLTMLFTRRFPSCEEDSAQQDDSGGWGMAYPTQCANVFAANFTLTWGQ